MWLLTILSSISICNGLFFEMTEKETKCFIEELPNDTILHGKYTTQLKEKDSDVYQKTAPGMGMHVEVKDPEKKVCLTLTVDHLSQLIFRLSWLETMVQKVDLPLHLICLANIQSVFTLIQPNGRSWLAKKWYVRVFLLRKHKFYV